MNRGSRIFVAGADSLIGAALLDLLPERGYLHVFESSPALTDAREVNAFFADARPEYVFLVGGKSGGIGLNRERPAELMLDNLRIISNVVEAAQRHGATKLLYLASACAYPKHAPQPMRVESLSSGPVEPTSEAYATAKIAGWKLCEAFRRQYVSRFISAFPANPFGPYDDFELESGHVIPALIRRAHDAKERGESELVIWGTGSPKREFIFSRDLADACLFVMQRYEGEAPINLGGGEVVSIAETARIIADVVGYRGRLTFDTSKPDGAPLKALDSSQLLAMGWRPSTRFRSAVEQTYQWFLRNCSTLHAEREEYDRRPHAPREEPGIKENLHARTAV